MSVFRIRPPDLVRCDRAGCERPWQIRLERDGCPEIQRAPVSTVRLCMDCYAIMRGASAEKAAAAKEESDEE